MFLKSHACYPKPPSARRTWKALSLHKWVTDGDIHVRLARYVGMDSTHMCDLLSAGLAEVSRGPGFMVCGLCPSLLKVLPPIDPAPGILASTPSPLPRLLAAITAVLQFEAQHWTPPAAARRDDVAHQPDRDGHGRAGDT